MDSILSKVTISSLELLSKLEIKLLSYLELRIDKQVK
jgi:hypothetical protein